jgi:hypothetical protein
MRERENDFRIKRNYYNAYAMLNFLLNVNANNHVSMNNVLFQNFNALKFYNFDFRCLQQKKKTKLERKQVVHFPRRTPMTEKRKSNHQYQTINDNPTKTFNDSKNTKQTKEFLNANGNCPFETTIN